MQDNPVLFGQAAVKDVVKELGIARSREIRRSLAIKYGRKSTLYLRLEVYLDRLRKWKEIDCHQSGNIKVFYLSETPHEYVLEVLSRLKSKSKTRAKLGFSTNKRNSRTRQNQCEVCNTTASHYWRRNGTLCNKCYNKLYYNGYRIGNRLPARTEQNTEAKAKPF